MIDLYVSYYSFSDIFYHAPEKKKMYFTLRSRTYGITHVHTRIHTHTRIIKTKISQTAPTLVTFEVFIFAGHITSR